MQVTSLINIRPPCLAATGNSPLAAKVPFTWLTEHTPNQGLRMTGFGGYNLPLVALAILGGTREGERENSELCYSYRERENSEHRTLLQLQRERENSEHRTLLQLEREGKKKRTQNFIPVTEREGERERTLNSELYYSYRERTQNSELYYSYGGRENSEHFYSYREREREREWQYCVDQIPASTWSVWSSLTKTTWFK